MQLRWKASAGFLIRAENAGMRSVARRTHAHCLRARAGSRVSLGSYLPVCPHRDNAGVGPAHPMGTAYAKTMSE